MNNKIEITVNINGIELKGELFEILNLLSVFYKVPSTVIYQFMGEIGIFVVDKQSISFTRHYCDDGRQLFNASARKIANQ